jgi:predicted nucleic acid-binding protein
VLEIEFGLLTIHTMIAGMVISTGAKLATRNVSRFDDLSTSVINSWQT